MADKEKGSSDDEDSVLDPKKKSGDLATFEFTKSESKRRISSSASTLPPQPNVVFLRESSYPQKFHAFGFRPITKQHDVKPTKSPIIPIVINNAPIQRSLRHSMPPDALKSYFSPSKSKNMRNQNRFDFNYNFPERNTAKTPNVSSSASNYLFSSYSSAFSPPKAAKTVSNPRSSEACNNTLKVTSTYTRLVNVQPSTFYIPPAQTHFTVSENRAFNSSPCQTCLATQTLSKNTASLTFSNLNNARPTPFIESNINNLLRSPSDQNPQRRKKGRPRKTSMTKLKSPSNVTNSSSGTVVPVVSTTCSPSILKTKVTSHRLLKDQTSISEKSKNICTNTQSSVIDDLKADSGLTKMSDDGKGMFLDSGSMDALRGLYNNLGQLFSNPSRISTSEKVHDKKASNQPSEMYDSNKNSAPPQSKTAESSSSLPKAAIKKTIVDNKLQYTIEINGKTVPVAGISVPTSTGTMELLSEDSNVKVVASESKDKPSKEDHRLISVSNDEAIAPIPPEVSHPIPTHAIETSSPKARPKSREKYTCEECGKTYSRSWSYYMHISKDHEDKKDKEVFSCNLCKLSFTTSELHKKHMMVHQGSVLLKCSKCSDTFSTREELKIHRQSHKEKRVYTCKIPGCGKQFDNASLLKVHRRVHQNEKPYKCNHPSCTKAFKTSSELSRHAFRHTGEKPFKCNFCDKCFVRNDDLRRHTFIHTGQKRFKCDECDFTCIQSFDLVKHKYIHGGEKPYKCEHCSKQFTRPARLREHQRTHTGERPYICSICGKSFVQTTSLRYHMLTHDANKPHKCTECDKSFVNLADLKTHQNTHLGLKPHECDICEKSFGSAKTLKRHKLVHAGSVEEDKPHKCAKCGKGFMRFNSLKEHEETHNEDNVALKCDVCSRVFNHQSHLNAHMRTHTGEKPFQCHVCGKEFARKISLKNHLPVHGISEDIEEDFGSNPSKAVANQLPGLSGDEHPLKIQTADPKKLADIGYKRRHVGGEANALMSSPKRPLTDGIFNSSGFIQNPHPMDRSYQSMTSMDGGDLSTLMTEQDSNHLFNMSAMHILSHDGGMAGSPLSALQLEYQGNDGNTSSVEMSNMHSMACIEPSSVLQHHQNLASPHTINPACVSMSTQAMQNAQIHDGLPIDEFLITHGSSQHISGGMVQPIIIHGMSNTNPDVLDQ